MGLLLCIDSSTTHASVALVNDGKLLCIKINLQQKDHASFLQPAIQEITKETGVSLSNLDAIAVTSGPGSYTGLRVGLASAKGLCYALNKPLITISTTKVMAHAAAEFLSERAKENESALLCPMIDARRMEVFTAVYTFGFNEVFHKQPLILNKDSFSDLLKQHKMYFFGDGAEKWKLICENKQAFFLSINWNAANMIAPATTIFNEKTFTPLVYATPEYLKEFHFIVK